MKINVRCALLVMMSLLLIATLCFADDAAKPADITADKPADQPAAEAAKTVTLDVKDQPVREALKQIAEGTGSTILAEKLVTGNVTVNIEDATLEKALGAVTKAGDLQWNKVYVPVGTAYVKDADALAAQVRLLLGLRFPDIVIAPSAMYSPVVHLQKDATASAFINKLAKETGLTEVYLVTNDKAYTKKLAKDEAKTKMNRYSKLAKEMMDLFLEMSPEERAEAMKEGLQFQLSNPEAMSDMMKAVFEMDPQYLTDMNQRAMQAMMQMDPEVRKNMLRMSMRSQFQMMRNMDPAQMQQFQREAMEVANELIQSGELPTPPVGTPGQ